MTHDRHVLHIDFKANEGVEPSYRVRLDHQHESGPVACQPDGLTRPHEGGGSERTFRCGECWAPFVYTSPLGGRIFGRDESEQEYRWLHGTWNA